MKTFTNYAEKKAKQILNLLQGYTKGIRMTAILMLLLMGVSNAWGATTATLYYSVPASTVGCYSVKCYYNFGYSQTGLVEMTKVDKTSSGNLIYSVTLTADHDNVDDLLFQLFDGNTWKSQQQVMKDWTPLANNSGKMYVHNTGWEAYSTDAAYTVYFVNKDSWTGTIKAYAWNSDCDKNKDWSGADMTSTGKTYQGKNIYSITLNKRYANIIFNNGSSQTGDLTLGSTNIGKMYDGSNWVDYNVDPVVTFKANGGTGSDYTQTVKYNTSTALTANTFTRTGYTFAGWNTKTDGTGTSYNDKQNVTLTANTTLYAKWTANQYTITYKDQGNVTFTGTHASGYPTKHTYGTTTTLATATKTGYTFDGWHTDAACTNKVTSLGATAYKANITLYAKWTINNTYSLTVVAGTGIASVTGSTDPVTLGNIYNITATPKTGYTFSTWTAEPADNATFGNATTANTTVTVNNGSVTVTASATENTHDVTVSYKYGDTTIKDNTTTSNVGEVTSTNITAPTIAGYTFSSWTLGTGITNNSVNTTTNPISITTKSSGNYTLTANYEEDLSTGWYLAGEFSNNGDSDTGWNTNKIEFTKLSGQSTGTVSYITMDLLPTTFTDDYKMSFKIVNGDTWYGNNGTYKKANNKQQWQFETSTGNCYLEVSLPGTYTFRLQSDSTDSKKYISIVYPIVNQLQVYTANPAHNDAIANWDWDSQNGDIYTKTLSLNDNTDYTFKAVINSAFYGQTTTLTRMSSSATLNTSGGNVTLSTDIAGDYIFTFNASNNQLAITYPEYTIVPIYLNLSDFTDWEKDNASFKIKYDNITTTFTQIGCSHYYTCEAPQEKNITIFRTDGASEWNPISTIVPTNANNCFKITGWTTGSWSTYTEPTHDITINAPESGTITVTIDGNTTTVTNEATTIEDVALNAQMTVAFTPATGYKLGKAIIQIGNNEKASAAGTYTVCGPTEITAYFVTTDEHVVYLRPTDAWLADNARFAAYAFNRYAGTEAAQWIELTTKDTDYTGAFSGTIPAGFSHVQFVRMPETGDFSFDIDSAQTLNYSIPTDGINNRFILGSQITSGSDKDNYQGSWEANDTPIYGIPGDWQGNKNWSADAYPLMGPNGEVTVNITQTNTTLGFKVYSYPYATTDDDQWLGNNSTMVRGGDAVHEGGWTMEINKNNCGLYVDIAGNYIFNFNIRNKKLTVQYPELPVPNAITVTSWRRLYDNTELDWFEGNGTEATPYKLYNDETIRLTVSPLTEVAGLTAYYKLGDNEEQTSNIFDWEDIMSEPTKTTIQAYYKNATGTSTETVSVETPYYIQISLPFYLMTEPSGEININRVAAGENILVQFRSDYAGTVGLYVGEDKLQDIAETDSYDYTYDVPNDIQPCVLQFKAQSTEPLHSRIFEATTEVAIYKNVIIKVHDPEGWVKNAYMWRDYSDAVLTQWPGDPVLQNFGTWRVFSVKYPYYDRFIVNDGNAENSIQTIDWELPADDTCYELLVPANNGSSDPADANKYGLQIADCPENLLVEDIKDTTIMEGEQIVVMPKIFVGLGYKLSDVRITQLNAINPSSVRAEISSTNIIILGYGIGESQVNVTYNLDGTEVQKTFKVTVEKNTNITIQVKVPVNFGDGNDYQWKDGTKIGIRYWGTGINGTDLTMDYAYTDATYHYAQAQLPLGTDDKINFHFYYESHSDENAKWRQSSNVTETVSRCYKLAQGSDYYRSATRDGDYCFDDTNYAQYQVKVFLPIAGKEYSSNVVTNTIDTLSFFAPGQNETGYRAGTVQLYKNGKMVAAINPTMFAESNVYTATVNETGDGLGNVAPYSGNFYIRTWGTDGDLNNQGWESAQSWTDEQKAERKFTYFVSREGEFYNHYWVQAMNSGDYDGKDVSACVANDYNDDLAGKLLQDKHTDEYGDIKIGTNVVINVRFGYDPRTNYFGRAILRGSKYDTYLNIHCDNAYYDKDCTKQFPYGTSNRDNKMYDISTWVYQRDIYVPIDNSHPSASLYLEATSPSTELTVTDHLLGYVTNEITGEATTTPIQKTIIGSGTTNGTYLIRVVYDFKTNRLIAAWLPQGTIDVKEDRTLNADVLFVRQENNEVPQIQLAENGKIRSLESLYFAIELLRGDEDSNNRRQEQYWFTLPFDCKVGSISGVPGYMQTWGIQRYRGDLRAQKGWYAETPTFWEWLDTEDVMHAGEGYLLVFDKKNAPFEEIEVDKMDAEGNIIDGQKETISMMRLYFPSMTSGFDMQQQLEDQLTRTYENHTCTLTLHDRYLQDSNWKVIGTTSYNNAGITGYTIDTDPEYEELSDAPSFRYSYEYNWENGFKYTYTPEDGKTATYNSFFGYMVQFAGTITWQPIMSETVPEGIAARRYVPENERTSFTTRLEIANAEGEKQDQAFVALDEKATTTFDQNLDLNKVMNSHKANIYTLSEGIPFAGNTLPMEKATVPVGVVTATAGEYTFRMPDGTDGISVTLVDNVTGTHTDMLMDEYTITLDAGTIENRFYLVVDPDRTATSVENIGEEAKGEEAKDQIKKFLIDGQLFIRTADGTFDAKGQRL